MNDHRTRAFRLCRMVPLFLLLASVLLNVALIVHDRVIQRLLARIEKPLELPSVFLNDRYHIDATPKLAFGDSVSNDEELFIEWQRKARNKLKEILRVDVSVLAESVRNQGSERIGKITRETLVLDNLDGSQVPGFLLLPDAASPRPVVMVIPGHSSGIVATSGIMEDYQHAVALRLAEAGYVVLTLEIRGLGYLRNMGKDGMNMDSFVGYNLGHGRCLASYTVADAAAGLSYVLSRKEVDPNHAGVLGFSSGGFPAVFLAALDDRINAVVASGCITSFDSLFQYSSRSSVEAVPGLVEWLEAGDCLCLLAPRHILVQWGQLDTDPNTRCASLTPASGPTVEVARRAYAVLGSRNRLEVLVSPNLGHEVDVPAAVDFFHRAMPIH